MKIKTLGWMALATCSLCWGSESAQGNYTVDFVYDPVGCFDPELITLYYYIGTTGSGPTGCGDFTAQLVSIEPYKPIPNMPELFNVRVVQGNGGCNESPIPGCVCDNCYSGICDSFSCGSYILDLSGLTGAVVNSCTSAGFVPVGFSIQQIGTTGTGLYYSVTMNCSN